MNKNILKFWYSTHTRGKVNFKLLTVVVFLFSFLILPNFVQAAECLAVDASGNCTQYAGFLDSLTCIDKGNCGLKDVAQGFINLTQVLIGSIGALALLYFIWGGIKWLTSYGNQQKIQQGRDIMLQTAIALVIAFMSYIIVSFFINNLLPSQTEVQVNTNTSYPAEPGQNNSNEQVATHCCVKNLDEQVDCQVIPVQNTCPTDYDENGPGNCSNVVMCDPNWHSEAGCCLEMSDNSVISCEDLSAGDICEFSFVPSSPCDSIPGNVCN